MYVRHEYGSTIFVVLFEVQASAHIFRTNSVISTLVAGPRSSNTQSMGPNNLCRNHRGLIPFIPAKSHETFEISDPKMT